MSEVIGYAWLAEHYRFQLIPHHLCSYLGKLPRTGAVSATRQGVEARAYDRRYDPEKDPIAHLMFALKHEGPNPHYLRELFQQPDIPPAAIAHIKRAPTGVWSRRLWFWYEWLTGETLPLLDCKAAPYQEVLDSRHYYCTQPVNMRRYCLRNNIPGTHEMIPLVRRTECIDRASDELLRAAIERELAGFDRTLIERAARYLISSETRSSSEIEGERLGTDKQLRFNQAIEQAGREPLTLDTLIEIQRMVRDPRYAESHFRCEQNYVGGAGFGSVSLVTPTAGDAHQLMDEWYLLYQRLMNSGLPVIVKAAVLSSQFIYIHPFMDGNGRVSRYIIQDLMARSGMLPKGLVLPVSAGILDRKPDYYQALDLLSREITKRTEYTLDERGAVTVHNNTRHLFQDLDFTAITEYLVEVFEQVVNNLLPAEIGLVQLADRLMDALDDELDMPAKELRLLIRVILDNGGRLSKTKRKRHFDHLRDDEIKRVDRICHEIMPEGI